VKALGVLVAALVLALPAPAARPRILPVQDAWPVWSPDGRSIAFTRIDSTGMTLEVVRLGGRPVAIARNTYQLEPSWSPDGKRIAYQARGSVYVKTLGGDTARLGRGGAPAYGPSVARVVDGTLVVDGAVWAKAVIGHPSWSPDGRRIAFQRDNGIYVAAGPGGGTRWFGAADPGAPAWSPDGSMLAFTVGDEVWVAGPSVVPAHALARGMTDASTPSWSPAGDAVVYSRRGAIEVSFLSGSSSVLIPSTGLGAAFAASQDLVAFAGPRPGCPGHDVIRVWADGDVNGPVTGTCEVRGTPKADVIEGSPLWGDVILAGAGNDQVHANDGHTDRVDCGPGRDVVWADRTDRLSGCEVVHR
jgi:dipeptidyl aminopeptidase/acylaminoacyl peptidase